MPGTSMKKSRMKKSMPTHELAINGFQVIHQFH